MTKYNKIVLASLVLALASTGLAQEAGAADDGTYRGLRALGAGLALGLGAVGTGIAQARIGSSLVGHLIGGMVGPAIARRSSFLLDSLGETLFDSKITIIDDPLLLRGLR